MKHVPSKVITLLSSNVPETDYTEWAIGTTYAAGDRVRKSAAHRVWESAVAGNIGHDPELDATSTYWLEVGATNRYAMLDNKVSSQTAYPSLIDVTGQVSGRVDTIGLLNIAATSATVTLTDAVAGIVYEEEFNLSDSTPIDNWKAYFFNEFGTLSDLVITDLPPYSGALIRVELSAPGETVLCGSLVVGQSRDLGGTRWSPRVGIVDYSVKQKTEFGDDIIVERAYSKRASFEVVMLTSAVSSLQNYLASYRATQGLWIGDEDIGALIIMGFAKEFEIDVATPTVSFCTLDIEG